MQTKVIFKKISGKNGVRLERDNSFRLMITNNMYYWSGFYLNPELIEMIKEAFVAYEAQKESS